jgi:ornithine decarboxylase
VKSNPDQRVLQVLKEEGVGFEIASIAELDQLLALGVPPAEIFYSNPMKSRAYVEYAVAKGVEWFVIDSVEELQKVHRASPTAKTYLRIYTTNVGSDWPLSGKFGAYESEIRDIIAEAARLGADLAGVTFHVGSQCLNPENWKVGLETTRAVFDQMLAAGLKPRLVNIGGGYPVTHTKDIPTIAEIGAVVNAGLAAFGDEVQVIGEPGRYLVSDAGYFVCRVVGTATREGKRWVYFDAGMFGGIIETTEGLKYNILTDRSGPEIIWTVAGPTCDSLDICTRDQALPQDLVEDDFIYIKNAGAYTTAYASTFNGFPLPDVIIL